MSSASSARGLGFGQQNESTISQGSSHWAHSLLQISGGSVLSVGAHDKFLNASESSVSQNQQNRRPKLIEHLDELESKIDAATILDESNKLIERIRFILDRVSSKEEEICRHLSNKKNGSGGIHSSRASHFHDYDRGNPSGESDFSQSTAHSSQVHKSSLLVALPPVRRPPSPPSQDSPNIAVSASVRTRHDGISRLEHSPTNLELSVAPPPVPSLVLGNSTSVSGDKDRNISSDFSSHAQPYQRTESFPSASRHMWSDVRTDLNPFFGDSPPSRQSSSGGETSSSKPSRLPIHVSQSSFPPGSVDNSILSSPRGMKLDSPREKFVEEVRQSDRSTSHISVPRSAAASIAALAVSRSSADPTLNRYAERYQQRRERLKSMLHSSNPAPPASSSTRSVNVTVRRDSSSDKMTTSVSSASRPSSSRSGKPHTGFDTSTVTDRSHSHRQADAVPSTSYAANSNSRVASSEASDSSRSKPPRERAALLRQQHRLAQHVVARTEPSRSFANSSQSGISSSTATATQMRPSRIVPR